MSLYRARTEYLRRRMKTARRLWVFAYGSLMWRPELPLLARMKARLAGFHRRFCIRSVHYRGTPKAPGLVLGLDRGGSCEGQVLALPADAISSAVDALWARELITPVYRPILRPVATALGPVAALTFTVRHDSPDYCPHEEPEAVADILLSAEGGRGTNLDYFASTLAHLRSAAVHDPGLEALARIVERRRSG